ncbi:MAG: diacylglycerol kinase family lipid kinase [Flavobacteriales bacterium]|nr:diacylglycerol kinase family lipid kinase [Flavobacteriales bacterium]
MKQALLVINPLSGKGRAPRVVQAAQRSAATHGFELSIRTVEGIGHGTVLAREAVGAGMDLVISAGGDGTLNAVAGGLIGTKVPVGVVAMGSGNGYARSLGLPLEPGAALDRAFTGTPGPMDVCFLNDIPFLGTAGIGFDARVAHRFDKSESRGMLGYARIIVQEIFGAPPMPVTVEANGERIHQDVLMVVFCNTREFGNGAVISPGSRPDDGLAEVRVVRKPSFFPLIKAFVQIYTHKADRSRYIHSITTTAATVRQGGTLAHLDGEPHEVGHEVRFRLEPERLWVVR